MECLLDHIALNVEDDEKMMHFYTEVLQLSPERLDLYRSGRAPFPSVRLNEHTIIDLFPKRMWDKGFGSDRTAIRVHHFCLALSRTMWQVLLERLQTSNVVLEGGPVPRWGAHGTGISVYFRDPEGNLIEARYYESDTDTENCVLGS